MEAHWTGRAQFTARAPKPTHRAQHKFLAGLLPEQGEATCQHIFDGKVLPPELLTEAVQVSRGDAGNAGSTRTA
jgi:hypothetical protein